MVIVCKGDKIVGKTYYDKNGWQHDHEMVVIGIQKKKIQTLYIYLFYGFLNWT